jgi:hypothetical protein
MTAHGPNAPDEPGAASDPPIYTLVYCSRATGAVDRAQLDRIIASAHRHNPAHGITGLLVYGSGIFFQWLEGPRAAVRGLMQVIGADPRHASIVQLTETEEVRDRLFPTWDMELVEAADIRDVLLDALSDAEAPPQRRALQDMLAQLDAGAISALAQA